MTPIEKRTRERIEKNNKIRLFKSVLWNIKEVELKIFIKDILEPVVDEKYYLSPLLQERFAKYLEEKNRIVNLQTRSETRPSMLKAKAEGKPYPGGHGILTKNDGTSYCLDVNCTQGVVDNLVYEAGRKEWRTHELSPTLKNRMGTGGNNVPMVANCIKVGGLQTKPEHYYEKKHSNIAAESGALRRLTPKECFRLMGFLNDEINLEGLSDTQRYKLSGNGQDVNMVSLIFQEMFK